MAAQKEESNFIQKKKKRRNLFDWAIEVEENPDRQDHEQQRGRKIAAVFRFTADKGTVEMPWSLHGLRGDIHRQRLLDQFFPVGA